MNKAFEEARDFVGADWEKLKPESRARLLSREGYSDSLSRARWSQVPETVKATLAARVMRSGR